LRSVFRHWVNEIYEIEYLGGKIRATGNHSVFVRTRRGIESKAVSELRSGDVLVDLPYKVNNTRKAKREVRSFVPDESFHLELPVWQPLFQPYAQIQEAYAYVLSHKNEYSQAALGRKFGFSQTAIGKWMNGISAAREISRSYFRQKTLFPEKVPVTPKLMKLFGYYAAEGYARKELDFCLNINERAKIEEIQRLVKEIFGVDPDREKNITPNAVNVIYYSKVLAAFFTYYCGKGARNKRLPPFLFTAPREHFVAFLNGYFAGDGYKDKRGRLEMTSVSKQLILELNWLSRMHGFKSFIHSFKAKGGRRIGNGKPLPESTAWRIGFGKTQNPFEKVSGKASTKRAIVKQITKIPFDGYVYDFCGCENEAFYGGTSPILLHNTNRPDVLDPALLRPGRFDRRVMLDLPDIKEREEILRIHIRGKRTASNIDIKKLAQRTPGFSGADLANLVNEAAILSARRNKSLIEEPEMLDAMERVILGPERKSHILTPKEREITAYHEAGHALVATFLPNADPVHKISIVSRGRAAGYTLKLPSEDRNLYAKSQFLDEIAAMLGGYATEKIVFKEITTGASNDLREASSLARKLVTQYGMSERMGPITYGKSQELMFLGREIASERNYSESVAAEIDGEVKRLIMNALKVAKNIVVKNRALLDKIAKRLIEIETLEREEFEALVKPYKQKRLVLQTT
jgi:intein/homing endonuclease